MSLRLLFAFSLAAMLSYTYPAMGQSTTNYPSKPIRLVVATPPGGAADILARLYVPKLFDQLGNRIVVDNRTGGTTSGAYQFVAAAAPDGYTLRPNRWTIRNLVHHVLICQMSPIQKSI